MLLNIVIYYQFGYTFANINFFNLSNYHYEDLNWMRENPVFCWWVQPTRCRLDSSTAGTSGELLRINYFRNLTGAHCMCLSYFSTPYSWLVLSRLKILLIFFLQDADWRVETILIVTFWYTSVAYQASVVEPLFAFWRDLSTPKYPWRDLSTPKYPWRDQTSLIYRRSVP